MDDMNNLNKIKKSLGVMKWGDFVLIGVVILLCAALWGILVAGLFDEAQYAEIVVKGEVVLRYDLTTQKKIFESAGINTALEAFSEEKPVGKGMLLHITSQDIHFDIDFQDGKARFSKSDCPDQICVHTGNIFHTGQIAACVPANVLIRIVGGFADTGDNNEADIILK